MLLLLLLLLLIIGGKIKTKIEVRQKAVAAILLLEAINDEEEKAKTSYKVRKCLRKEGANGYIKFGEGTCLRRHAGFLANDENEAQAILKKFCI